VHPGGRIQKRRSTGIRDERGTNRIRKEREEGKRRTGGLEREYCSVTLGERGQKARALYLLILGVGWNRGKLGGEEEKLMHYQILGVAEKKRVI